MMRSPLRRLLRLLRLATSPDLEPLATKAARLAADADALALRLDALLDDAYGEAPVIRIHHGAPPHLH